MGARRQNLIPRCPECLIQKSLCFCEHIPHLNTLTKVSMVVHIKERVLTSNTASLAHLSLNNSELIYRGLVNEPFHERFELDKNYTPLYLYPSEQAHILDKNFLSRLEKPVQLIVPDGTWKQAKKVHKREAILKDIHHVKLPYMHKSFYSLRKQRENKGVCTLEAIAYALGIIESKEIETSLLDILKIKNTRMEQTRTI